MTFERSTQGHWVKLSALMSEGDLAARWQKSLRSLQRYRSEGTGPAWIRIGGSVFYRAADVQAFEEAARRPGAQR